MLEAMRDAGIPTVVWLSPILPFINDTEENLRGLLGYCVRANVRAIMCFGFGMTLREGNREYFYQQLDRLFPGMRQRYTEQFGDAYVCNSPNHKRLMAILREVCERHGILCGSDTVFAYLREFTPPERQLSLFD
jgi:DNA repair photolyase